jgi:hypothetical protein
MSTLDCRHEAPAAGLVCAHLLDGGPEEYHRRFTGQGLQFHLLCPECLRDNVGPPGLRTVCKECFALAQRERTWSGIAGQPEIRERPSRLSFLHESAHLAGPIPDGFLDIQPVENVDRNLWIALTRAGELVRLDLDEGTSEPLCRLPPSQLDLAQAVSLHLSWAGRLAAIVNTRSRHGIVIDLDRGRPTMPLERDDYHNQHCTFPVAFFEAAGRTLLIHATAWNRLDVSDPLTGTLLTARALTAPADQRQRLEHDLDYFHCRLTVSPDGQHVAEDGWIWHPVGVVVTWDTGPWLAGNVWESEDGLSRKTLTYRVYHWDSPLCWVAQDRLAVWGYGEDDDWLIPAARIFDVARAQEVRWFAGPKGNLVFDDYLFSFDANDGTSIWDVDSGERLLREEGFCPHRYHRGARLFLTPATDGSFQVSRLRGRPIDPDWLSANGGAVARLARGIALEQDFHALPVLADALEEAGCQDPAILGHCRQPKPHTRRCWVVDLLVENE